MVACPFCVIDETRQKVLSAYPYVYIMQSNPSLVRYHMLVIPHRHVARLSDLKPDEFSELWRVAADLQWQFLVHGTESDIRQNPRQFRKQDQYTVPHHLHIHVIPRALNDELYMRVQIHEKALFDERMLSEEQIQQEMEELKRII